MNSLLQIVGLGALLGLIVAHTLGFGLSMRMEGRPGLLGACVLALLNAAAFVFLIISR
ncbi:hypothetical protein [Paenibacillus sp.]|uniref:hypothetical protein n=1 Tax=Paenibacillus sp. TaxID=58172 RepID=UPI002D275310|nr:hypothetical protein [Paenibacillus sp.]HZG83964.1 hypothetical protein [Paenibacillus sp.]